MLWQFKSLWSKIQTATSVMTSGQNSQGRTINIWLDRRYVLSSGQAIIFRPDLFKILWISAFSKEGFHFLARFRAHEMRFSSDEIIQTFSVFLIPLWPPKVRVPQLKVDGSGERGLSRAAQSLHPPGLPGLRRDVDASGGQLWQAETDQQRTGRPGACMCQHKRVKTNVRDACLCCYYNNCIFKFALLTQLIIIIVKSGCKHNA